MKYQGKYKSILFFFLLLYGYAGAQDHVARARINGVTDSGFYKILLAPKDKEFARYDLGNLRIIDQQDREIPYIIEHGNKLKQEVAIEDFHFTTVQDTLLKKTILDLYFDYPVQFSQLRMDITAPALYKREATIFYWPYENLNAGEHGERVMKMSRNIQLFSEDRNTFDLQEIYVKNMRIEIMNHDDAPLTISSIRFIQKPTYIICCLRPGETYYLSSFAMDKPAPQYDLRYFRDKITSKLPIANLEETEKKGTSQSTTPSTHQVREPSQSKWFMWACIGVGGLLTIFIASRLMKDMGKN